ncbi:ribosome maturation factor RimM [Lactovum miscens]|uniref:Ribosome maturation factor RimM n=1 Tax=Lactovum miscens TaxID=190387 RepID=A0A841C6G4_9LACT|nr:ribosome maturation factor RimM [Lactovum miscens]MBB5887934.1 16S rRNA processing protein RimM [Lactovum miscens]
MNFYNVAVIVNEKGLQGEVKVKSLTDFSEERFAKKSMLSLFNKADKFVSELEISHSRKQKNVWILKFSGLNSINDVEPFKGFTLKIAEENLTELGEGEFYYHDIIGLDVFSNDEKIGIISEILQPGANDVWVVKRQDKTDLLLPYIDSVIINVSVKHNRVDVVIPEGLDD